MTYDVTSDIVGNVVAVASGYLSLNVMKSSSNAQSLLKKVSICVANPSPYTMAPHPLLPLALMFPSVQFSDVMITSSPSMMAYLLWT